MKSNRNFLRGRMNKDVDERVIPNGEYIDALNIDIVHAEGSDAGTVRNKYGNTKIKDLSNVAGLPTDSSTLTIGAVISETDNLIYYLVASDTFDGIYEYSEHTGEISRVLQSNKATPSTPSQLNFNKDYYVTGINFLEGLLYWTDNFNPPRRVNISRAKEYSINDSRIDDDISVIIAPPLDAPVIEMFKEQTNITNIQDKFIQFSTRYKYKDDQYSAMSPFSATAFIPGTFLYDYAVGDNLSMQNSNNRVNIQFETGNQFVEEIQLLYRSSDSSNIYIVDSFDKAKLGISNNTIHDHNFSNNKIYKTLSTKQLFRLYDNVPLKAKAQEVIGRRIVYGNYTQGYDIVDDLGNEILIDYKVGYSSKGTALQKPIQTFRSDRDYEVGIIYGDDYGRFSTVLTSLTNTVNIPPEASITGNSLRLEISNTAPTFATNYRVVIKQSKKAYYNIFPILYYSDGGLYRYFKINPSDIDKIAVNEYVIFKSDFTGPTLSNRKYKVLSITEESAGQFGSGSLSGLYFKIKVDDISEFNGAQLTTHISDDRAGRPSTTPFYPGGSVTPGNLYITKPPITDDFNVAEDPIHYGIGESSALSVSSNTYTGTVDKRYTIEVTGDYEFKWTYNANANGGWTVASANEGGQTVDEIELLWDLSEPLTVGDRWKINCRTSTGNSTSALGGRGVPFLYDKVGESSLFGGPNSTKTYSWIGESVLPAYPWRPLHTGVADDSIVDVPIEVGSIVQIMFASESLFETRYQSALNNPNSTGSWIILDAPPSPRRYENIEEWFYESGAMNDWNHENQVSVNNTTTGGFNFSVRLEDVSFRRAFEYGNPSQTQGLFSQGGSINASSLKYPVRMILPLYNNSINSSSLNGAVEVQGNTSWDTSLAIRIVQAESFATCETTAKDSDTDIFYETSKTYRIEGGLHKSTWAYDDFTDKDGYVNIGQSVPGTSPSTIERHTFTQGDTIQVNSTTISGSYEVREVVDPYNVVLDLAYVAGPDDPGTATFYQTDIDGIPIINRDQTSLQPAVINLNQTQDLNSTYNAYAFGNGVETYRIRDSFNSPGLDYSPRATIAIEDYKQEVKEASLTYSGVFKSDSSVNRLNEFNSSDVNFKNLDLEFGSVQKLHARDTDLLVLQEDKISKVLNGKNLLSDSSGGGTITSIPEVLGTQISMLGEWGISFNPESFSSWASDIFFTDSRRGSVLRMRGDEIRSISDEGLRDYFKDLFKDNLNTKKIGVYSPYNDLYILASNEDTSLPCRLSINISGKEYPSRIVGSVNVDSRDRDDFFISSNTSWTMDISYGSGSGWVSGFPAQGEGNRSVRLSISNNNTGAVRTAVLTATYCSGATETFTITQARSKELTVVSWVSNKK